MAIKRSVLRARIENAAEVIGPLWPLTHFNAANPLSGFEDQPFHEAVQRARQLFGGRAYPRPAAFRQAWEQGEIIPSVLARRLEQHGISETPAALLDRMAADEATSSNADAASDDPLDRVMTKWLAAFLDQGQAAWPMPHRADGFYAAWRAVAPYDDAVPGVQEPADLPDALLAAFRDVLGAYPEAQWERIFIHHFTALPGWTGFIKWRARQQDDPWQQAHPISLADYLAVRLVLAKQLGRTIAPERIDDLPTNGVDATSLPALWLEAWEESYRQHLLDALRADREEEAPSGPEIGGETGERPAAQLAFCIDVRSEIIRRHIERAGPYETHGYAGFFGIPMQHERYDGVRVKSCPPIVNPRHRIAERPAPGRQDEAERYDGWRRLANAGRDLVKTLKNNVAAAFGFVEGSGGFFGAALAGRTLAPSALARLTDAATDRVPGPDRFGAPTVDRAPDADDEGRLPVGLSHEAKVTYAEAAFRLMGWVDTFAPLVVFTGHGSQTPNNPYKSSLDCGACAGNPGGPNAKVLAALCNDPDVRTTLRERGIALPDDTTFVAARHNTTTDAVTLFVDEDDPPAPPEQLRRLREDLAEAQKNAAAERVGALNADRPDAPVQETRRRAADWAETRPEWGLAGNAGFIVGPRALTAHLDLEGRCFLHSYDWRTDEDGTALENIMTGPVVVGEWINMQYYFSTIDNGVYGSGSKVTHNVVGKIGVVQGNGGDLMSGLPLQSLRADDVRVQHRPLRLFTVIQAPVGRVEAILDRQDTLAQLLDHEWIALAVMDPEQDDRFLRYQPGGRWAETGSGEEAPPQMTAAAA